MSSKTTMLGPEETRLVGQWLYDGGKMLADPICERIEHLTSHVLVKVAISPESGAWETLFKDPADGRFWERTYPGGMQGGGPPSLLAISSEDAIAKYGSMLPAHP